MADFIKNPIVPLPDQRPEPVIPEAELKFTAEEKGLIDRYKRQYANPQGAVMKVLWLAQEKFGYLPPEVIQLVADEVGIPYSVTYGVATFYTQYYKQKTGKFVLDVCTCFSCQFCGGYDMLHYLEEKLGVHAGETTPDGLFTVQEAECLGACGSAPMLQVTNGPYVHNLTREKIDEMVEMMRQGKMPVFTSVTLPQDEVEMGGNRRTDIQHAEPYVTPPVSETVS
jgi:NADH-quinone oxidoreductase subunit E